MAAKEGEKRHDEEEKAERTGIRRQSLNSYHNHAGNAYDVHSQRPSKLSHTSAKKIYKTPLLL